MWEGGKFAGEVVIDEDTRPAGAKPEKFSLHTVKLPDRVERYVRMDASNKFLANCEIPIDDTYTAGVMGDLELFFKDKSAVRHATVDSRTTDITMHSGDLTLKGNTATVSILGVVAGEGSRFITVNGVGSRQASYARDCISHFLNFLNF